MIKNFKFVVSDDVASRFRNQFENIFEEISKKCLHSHGFSLTCYDISEQTSSRVSHRRDSDLDFKIASSRIDFI